MNYVSYFSTTAQVIPVLWLALVLEMRYGQRRESSAPEVVTIVIVSLSSLLAEFLSLTDIVRQGAHPAISQLYVGAVIALLLWLLQWAVIRRMKTARLRAVTIGLLGAGVVGLTVAVLDVHW